MVLFRISDLYAVTQRAVIADPVPFTILPCDYCKGEGKVFWLRPQQGKVFQKVLHRYCPYCNGKGSK